MLYIFDLDSTLVVRFKLQPLAGVMDKLADLAGQHHKIAVATNQAGLAWRVWTGDGKYPAPDRLGARFDKIAHTIPQLLHVPWFVALHDSRVEVSGENYARLAVALAEAAPQVNLQISAEPVWRKPGPGMLQAAMLWYAIPPAEVVYVGDMETDAEAASAAGIAFSYAETFFDGTQSVTL